MTYYIRIALIFSLFFLTLSCSRKIIPNTSLRKNSVNITISSFLEKYRKAVESRNIEEIMSLVSKNFIGDDHIKDSHYGYDNLKRKLEKTFSLIKKNRLGFHIQHVEQHADRFHVHYYFSQHALINYPSGEKWVTKESLNKMVLIKDKDGELKIVSGI